MHKTERKRAFDEYIAAALWSSTNNNGDSFEYLNYSKEDISPRSYLQQYRDWVHFTDEYKNLLDHSGLSPEQIAHDFWLTRARHGAGFWDRGIGQIGEALTHAAQLWGAPYVYVGDDGKVHFC